MADEFNFDSFQFDDFDSGISADGALSQTPDISDIVTNLRKRVMVVVAIVDISPSMKGARIGAVNDALRNVINELRKREHGNTSAEIRLSVMTFAGNARCIDEMPVPIGEYAFSDIEPVISGGTFYSKALTLLNQKLSPRAFMKSAAGAYTPLLIFMTDGKPSDPALYRDELRILEENKWFRYSTRAAIAIGKEASSAECRQALLDFTRDEKNIFEARNAVMLAKQIELVTLTGVDFATKQGSVQNVNTQSSQTAVVESVSLPPENSDEFAFETDSSVPENQKSTLNIDLTDINDEDWSF